MAAPPRPTPRPWRPTRERPLPKPDGRLAWIGLCSALALAVLVALHSGRPLALVWHASAWQQHPWMLWTASLAHLSLPHAAANLGALLLLAVLGALLHARWPATLAVLLAWPLGTLALAGWPQVHWYAGMSGLLMAMLAVLVVHAWRPGSHIAAAVLLAALLAKLLSERAWAQPMAFDPQWGFNVVQAAHLSGALAGFACAWLSRIARLPRGAGPAAG